MASRLFQFRYSYERDVCEIMAKITIGASGAPTLTQAKGIVSMVRNSAGNYTLTLKDNYYLFLSAEANFISGSSAPAAPFLNVVSEQVSNATSPQVVLQFRNLAAAAATDPASGEVVLLRLVLRSAST